MIKVLIVEDEYLVRIGLKSIIQWESEGFTLIGDASNGLQAFDLYEKYKPDIIITDIQLPKMNGLEFISKVRETDNQTKFVIISCHSDFTYAKKAIEYGVSHYFEKSDMGPNQLLQVLIQLKHKIKQNETIHDKLDEQSIITQDESIRSLLKNKGDNAVTVQLENLNISLEHKTLVCLYFNQIKSEFDTISKEVFLTIAKEMMIEDYQGFVVEINPNVYTAVISYNRNKFDGTTGSIQYISRIKNALHKICETTFRVIFSDTFKDIEEIPSIYYKLEKFKNYLIFLDPWTSIGANIFKDMIDENYLTTVNFENLYNLTLFGENEKVVKQINEIFLNFKVNHYSLINLYGHCNQMIATLNKVMRYYYEFFSSVYDQVYIEYDVIRTMESLDEIQQWFTTKYNDIAIGCSRYRFYDGTNELVYSSISYMINHHKEPLTLEDVASENGISRVYLSQLLKKETNKNFVDIFNHIRIESAKLLMADSKLKVYEIGNLVGFTNQSSYFIKVFKNITGLTPTEYRKSMH